jgi:tetratricopeptide (TPR) repeat protein
LGDRSARHEIRINQRHGSAHECTIAVSRRIDRALRVSMSCLDEDTVVAFTAGRLALDEIPRVEAHAHACPSCRELVSLAFAAASMPPARQPEALPESTGGHQASPPGGAATLPRGTSFGRYTILEPIGRGAMGEVYAAFDAKLDRKVALKILHTRGQGPDAEGRGRLLREAKALAKLRHPNVVVVFDAGEVDDRVFLAMEYVEGQTLAAWLAERPRSHREILAVFVAAGRGLVAAHAAGLVHRDFKPQNVMVERNGDARVTDFGLARQADKAEPPTATEASILPADARDLRLTRTGELVGTPLYMAPEQFRTQRADARSDQFSFCVALYQALYGAHPFGGQKLLELASAVARGQVQPPPPRSTVPLRVRRILLRGLSPDPSARWQSMEALTAALSRDPAQQRRRWAAFGLIGAAAVAGVAALRAPRRPESICRGGPALLAGVWETNGPNTTATRRAATREAFLKTGIPGADDIWARAASVLDRYTVDWLRMYEDSCAATHLRGEQSAEVLDLRTACLQERRTRIKALTDVFLEANATVIDNAVTATAVLPSLDRCADVKLLRAVFPPPDRPEVRAHVESLRADLARVAALGDSGQCTLAAAAKAKVIATADQLGYAPMQAESRTVTTRVRACVPTDEYLGTLKRAVVFGLASHHDEAVAEAAITIAAIQANETPDIARAREWVDLAGAVLQGMSGSHAVLESWRLQALGYIYGKEGRGPEALDTLERARSLIEKTQGTRHLDYAIVLNNIGLTLVDMKRYADALDYYRRAIDLTAKVGRAEHAEVATWSLNMAEALNALHRHDEARAAAERTLAIWQRSGTSRVYRAIALTMLGEAVMEQGHPREAATRLREALDLFQDERLSPYAYEARFALARALWGSSGERRQALALARDASAGYQRLGNHPDELAQVNAWLRARPGAR